MAVSRQGHPPAPALVQQEHDHQNDAEDVRAELKDQPRVHGDEAVRRFDAEVREVPRSVKRHR